MSIVVCHFQEVIRGMHMAYRHMHDISWTSKSYVICLRCYCLSVNQLKKFTWRQLVSHDGSAKLCSRVDACTRKLTVISCSSEKRKKNEMMNNTTLTNGWPFGLCHKHIIKSCWIIFFFNYYYCAWSWLEQDSLTVDRTGKLIYKECLFIISPRCSDVVRCDRIISLPIGGQ